MGIKKIEVFPQIYLYKKSYIDLCLATLGNEPHVDVGAWFGLEHKSGLELVQYTMNPGNISATLVPLTIYNIPSGLATAINTSLTYSSLLEYFREVNGAKPYSYESEESTVYNVVEIESEDFLIPKHVSSPSPVPIHVRYMYKVTHSDDLIATFPGINQSYETVLNAAESFKFVPSLADERFGVVPTWKLYFSTGEYMADSNGTFPNITGVSTSQEFYVAVKVPVRGGMDASSVSHYNDNIFLEAPGNSEIVELTRMPPNSDLLTLLGNNAWSLDTNAARGAIYDNRICYRLSGRWSKWFVFPINEGDTYFSSGTLRIKSYEPDIGVFHYPPYSINITLLLVELQMTALSTIEFTESIMSAYNIISVANPSAEDAVTIDSFEISLKEYAIRSRNSSNVLLAWGAKTIPAQPIDVTGLFSTVWGTLNANEEIPAGYTVEEYIHIDSTIANFLTSAGISIPAGNTPVAGVFLFEYTLNYNTIQSVSKTFLVRIGYSLFCDTVYQHEIIQSTTEDKKWIGIKNVAIRFREPKLSGSEIRATFGGLYLDSISLQYTSPSNNTIEHNSHGINQNLSTWTTISSNDAVKLITIANASAGTYFANPSGHRNVNAGRAYYIIKLSDDAGNQISVIPENIATSSFDVVNSVPIVVMITPEGSEIDTVSESTIEIPQ